MFVRSALCAVVLITAFAPMVPNQAMAATVEVLARSQAVTERGTVFTAAPGEVNDVTVTHQFAGPDQTFATIHDSGTIVDAGSGCASLDPHTVRCLLHGVVAWFDLGDGDDRLLTLEPSSIFAIVANGGPGDDVLHILANDHQADHADCGDGDDTIYVNSAETTDTWVNCEHVIVRSPKSADAQQDQ